MTHFVVIFILIPLWGFRVFSVNITGLLLQCLVIRYKFRTIQRGPHLKQTGCEDVDWIHVEKDRIQRRILVNMAMNIQVS
jgi:hypothetical protein